MFAFRPGVQVASRLPVLSSPDPVWILSPLAGVEGRAQPRRRSLSSENAGNIEINKASKAKYIWPRQVYHRSWAGGTPEPHCPFQTPALTAHSPAVTSLFLSFLIHKVRIISLHGLNELIYVKCYTFAMLLFIYIATTEEATSRTWTSVWELRRKRQEGVREKCSFRDAGKSKIYC